MTRSDREKIQGIQTTAFRKPRAAKRRMASPSNPQPTLHTKLRPPGPSKITASIECEAKPALNLG
jgi:hypothetical protein